MPGEKDPKTISPRSGVLNEITTHVKLVLRLMADRRVNPLIKLLPFGSFVYLLIPDLLIGPIDDAVLLWLGIYLFIELCPPDIVQEHRAALNQVVSGSWHDPLEKQDEEIIDGEFHQEE